MNIIFKAICYSCNHCHTVEQRLHLERARDLNLKVSNGKVYNFYCLSFEKNMMYK